MAETFVTEPERESWRNSEPRFYCLACLDEPNGWRIFWCRGDGRLRAQPEDKPRHLAGTDTQPCGRTKEHPPHSYSERCACRDTNPVIAEHRRRQAEYATRRGLKARRGED